MWTLNSTDTGYDLMKDGKLKGHLCGTYQECMEIVKLLNTSSTAIPIEQV